MLEEKLVHAGLSGNEAKVYLSVLSLGKSRLGPITERTGFNHVTTLNNLKSLEEKRFIHCEKAGLYKHYFPVHPRQAVKQYLQQIQSTMDEKKQHLDDVLDPLEVMYASLENKPSVKFVEGVEDVPRAVQLEVQNTKFQELYEFTNLDESYHLTPPHRGDHRSVNYKRPHQTRCIYTSIQGPILRKKRTKKKQIFYIPKHLFDFPGEVSSFGDKVILIAYQPSKTAVIIKNNGIAKTIQALFHLALESVTKYQ